jgi:hypothetical protein
MLVLAIVAAIFAAGIWLYVPASVCTVLFSDSIALRTAMWMYITIALLLPFCWSRGRDTVFLVAACTLCRIILMAPAAWLLSYQLEPLITGPLDVRGIYYLVNHSLPWWTKASMLLLNLVWYYVVFRFVKSVTAVPSWVICGVLAIGALCLEVVSAFYYSRYISVVTMIWLLVGNGLGMLIIEIEKNGTNGLKKWILGTPVNADHEKG